MRRPEKHYIYNRIYLATTACISFEKNWELTYMNAITVNQPQKTWNNEIGTPTAKTIISKTDISEPFFSTSTPTLT